IEGGIGTNGAHESAAGTREGEPVKEVLKECGRSKVQHVEVEDFFQRSLDVGVYEDETTVSIVMRSDRADEDRRVHAGVAQCVYVVGSDVSEVAAEVARRSIAGDQEKGHIRSLERLFNEACIPHVTPEHSGAEGCKHPQPFRIPAYYVNVGLVLQ